MEKFLLHTAKKLAYQSIIYHIRNNDFPRSIDRRTKMGRLVMKIYKELVDKGIYYEKWKKDYRLQKEREARKYVFTNILSCPLYEYIKRARRCGSTIHYEVSGGDYGYGYVLIAGWMHHHAKNELDNKLVRYFAKQ